MNKFSVDDYRPAPFWFLNHKLEQKELNRQLRLMKDQGVLACFLHPRAGLRTPYGTDEWFTLMRNTALEAKRLGMKLWLYDEDPFPSGMAGGRIFLDHPEFAARGLVFQELTPDGQGKISADLGEHRLVEAIAVKMDEAGNVLQSKDIFNQVGMLRDVFLVSDWFNPYYHHLVGKTTFAHRRAATCYPHLQLETTLPKGWKALVVTAQTFHSSNYRFIPDNLNPACAREFIRLTHAKYEETMGDLFGTVIPGIFTDETAVGADMPWTPAFDREFLRLRGFPITGRYHLLFRGDSKEAQELRLAYWKTVQELFENAFFKPIYNWCKKHHLELCGHEIGEEYPLCGTNGLNNYALQKWFGIPGFDHITPNIPNWSDFTSLNLGGLLVSSAAAQSGKPRVMSECFGCNAYNFGHDGMKRDMHWLYALGVNFLVPHGFHYSYDGLRKDDAGKSFFFQSPDWEKFHEFCMYSARLGYRLGQSRSTTDICMFFPDSEFRRLHPAQTLLAKQKIELLYAAMQQLIQNQTTFEFADDAALSGATVTKDGFRVGKKLYRHLLVPFPLSDDTAVRRLRPFLRSMKEALGFPQPFRVLDAATGRAARTVICQHRTTRDGHLLYFFHNDGKPATFRIVSGYAKEPNLFLYDAQKDSIASLGADSTVSLPPYGAALVFASARKSKCPPYRDATPPTPDFAFLSKPEWDYIPALPNLLAAIRDWSFQGGGELHANRRYAYLRDCFGSDGPYPQRCIPKHYFDSAPERPKFFPKKITATATFRLPATAEARLLLEHDTLQGDCTVAINGKPIPPLVRKLVYDPWNLVADISGLVKKGNNTIRITWPAAREFDGLASMVYVVGTEAKGRR